MARHQGMVRAYCLRFALLACLLIFGACGAPRAVAAGEAAPVRLSFVSGQVRIMDGDRTVFDQAAANMPVLEGYQVETGSDGQAELEFEDGSIARLTPNSSLQLDRIAAARGRAPMIDLADRSGLVYYELNITEGQRFAVRFAGATARPTDNSVFRINLDQKPQIAVMQGAVHIDRPGAFATDVKQNQSVRLEGEDAEEYALTDGIPLESWDRWNADRDQEIASMAQNQTEAREMSGDSGAPGWNDLDSYGNWYPVAGYGNVWAPAGVGPGWDPFGYGYWANYPGWGYTWISGYPWGWLPYHCGAWNYFNDFGWGWIPGQCGLGWSPIVTIWNAPGGYRPPPRPIPGGHIASGPPGHLVPVDRGPSAHGPLRVLGWRGVHALNTGPVRLDGRTVAPLPRAPAPVSVYRSNGPSLPRPVPGFGSGHVGVPVPPGSYNPVPGVGGRPAGPVIVRPPVSVARPLPSPQPMQPRVMAPAPRMVAPPPPSPRISAPPAPAPRPR